MLQRAALRPIEQPAAQLKPTKSHLVEATLGAAKPMGHCGAEPEGVRRAEV